MRRKRGGSGRDVLIDLTSLLDVMFIILLIVMWGQNQAVADAEAVKNQVAADAEAAIKRAEAEYGLYEQQTEIAENINQYVCAVSVVVPYDKENVIQREIKILKEGEQIESFALIGNDVADSVEAFGKSLRKYIEANADLPVILSLNENDDNILYRDEVMVIDLFLELTQEYNNVYIRGSMNEEEK